HPARRGRRPAGARGGPPRRGADAARHREIRPGPGQGRRGQGDRGRAGGFGLGGQRGLELVSGAEDRLSSVEEAREAILAAIPGPLAEEVLPVDSALGRVLARDVAAAVTLPPWDNSAMDGYAVRAADVAAAAEAVPVRLAITGEV